MRATDIARSLAVAAALALLAGCPERCAGERAAPAAPLADAAVGSGFGPGPPGEGEDVVTDPYCGVRLRRSEAAATLEHHGQTYYFCLRDHMEAFGRDPDRYLRDLAEADAGAGAAPDATPSDADAP